MSVRRLPMDWPLVAIALTLSVYGIAIVYSAGQTDVLTAVARLWRSQVLGVLIMKQPKLGSGIVLVGSASALPLWAGASGPSRVRPAGPVVGHTQEFTTGICRAWLLRGLAVGSWSGAYMWEAVSGGVSNGV